MAEMFSIHAVTYRYPGSTEPALRNISFEIPRGQFCALVGPNGAGKSTLAYALTGFIPHFYRGHLEGTITVDGKLTAETPLHDLIRSAGLIFQNPFNQISGTKFTVLEEIAFGLENLGVPPDEMRTRVREIMAMLEITDLADRSPVALSGGQMQRVAIASVLAMHPDALILDEPTSQLDPIGSREVFAAVRALAANAKTTILMIEHKLEWVAQFADRVIALSAGEIIADGQPDEILTDPVVIQNGIGQTRYTMAARAARQRGFQPAGRPGLPVTLDQAVGWFDSITS